MRTLLLQTYRTTDQPDWVAACLASAKALADQKGWGYRFRGDDIFDLVPDRLVDKFAAQKPLLCDIARLAWAREVFESTPDVERVVWLDADVFVFDAEAIEIDPDMTFAVGRQVWVQPSPNGGLKSYRQVHNAVLMFHRTSSSLNFLLDSVIALADRHGGAASPQLLGPKLLTALHNILGFSVIESVGMASPLVMQDLANFRPSRAGEALSQLITDNPHPLGALNLCTSYRGQTVDGIACSDDSFERAMTALRNGAIKGRAR